MRALRRPPIADALYVVFEDLGLAKYGNRLPQLSFEVFRPLDEDDNAEGQVRAVCMIPAAGEFTYATRVITSGSSGEGATENAHATGTSADMIVALDRLEAMAPSVQSVSLVVSWFGDDLRCGTCLIRPGVDQPTKTTSPASWGVNGVTRGSAYQVSTDSEGRANYGGTPADFSVVEAIQDMQARGLKVTLSPFVMMDVPLQPKSPQYIRKSSTQATSCHGANCGTSRLSSLPSECIASEIR